MPNWCSNRMYFSGEPAQIAEIKRLASGAVTPLYRRATNEGIQLFLAGSAGLLQITENIRSEQCPGVTAAGRGAVSPENIAFTRWLTHLQNGVLLDEQNCLMLHELWLQSGTGQRRWEELPDDVRETITVHFTAKRGDWCDIWGNEDVSVWWNRLCDNVLPEKTMPFDLLTVLPTRLDIEVNGFNGGVLNGVPRAGTLTGLHPMQVCRCRRPPHPVTFRRSSSTRCGFGAAPAFVCGRPVTGAARPDGGRM
ncbi:Protein of uncharacterised function (DUF1281) [Shigella sonnei]|nr:Protein of uncharacterised function (DUF1281) [Shigella sonnei]